MLVYQRVTENELFDKLSNIGRDHTVSTNPSQGTSSIPFPRAIIFSSPQNGRTFSKHSGYKGVSLVAITYNKLEQPSKIWEKW